nr:hypothetical protein [Alicyclobacillus tolerans]
MVRSNRTERLAVSFPIFVALFGFFGWVTKAVVGAQSQKNQGRQ